MALASARRFFVGAIAICGRGNFARSLQSPTFDVQIVCTQADETKASAKAARRSILNALLEENGAGWVMGKSITAGESWHDTETRALRESLRETETKLRSREAELAKVQREFAESHHRIANNLQIIM